MAGSKPHQFLDADYQGTGTAWIEDTIEPQVADPEVDYIGSSTVKRIGPNNVKTNTPGPESKRVPAGAKVINGVIHIG